MERSADGPGDAADHRLLDPAPSSPRIERAGIRPRVDELLSPGEVARVFGVDPKTVTRWSDAGRLPCTRTLGGHRRFRRSDVERLLANGTDD